MRTPPPSLVRAPSGGSFYRVRSLFHSSKEEKEELLLTSSLVLDESGVGVGGGVAGGETGGEDRAAGSIEGRLSGSGGDGARSFISLLSDFSSHGEGLRFLSEALHEVRTALVVAGRPWLVSSRCFCLFFPFLVCTQVLHLSGRIFRLETLCSILLIRCSCSGWWCVWREW